MIIQIFNEWSILLFKLETGEVNEDSSLMYEKESTGYKRAFILFEIGMDTLNNNYKYIK